MKFTLLFAALFCLFEIGCTSAKKNPTDAANQTPPPKLLAPSVKKIWIPAAIKNGGTEWEEGHFIYRIERETVWSR
jgi:hypothetical protein